MPKWGEGRWTAIFLTTAFAVGTSILAAINAGNIWRGWPNPAHIFAAILGTISAVSAVGLYLRQIWSRWLGVVLMIGIFALVYRDGIPLSWWSVLFFLFMAHAIWWFWRLPVTVEEESRRKKE
jgi:hypothetical protein